MDHYKLESEILRMLSRSTQEISLPRYRHCFVCGVANPAGLDITFYYRNRRIEAEIIPRPEHAGYRDVVHGGILATLLDETMGWSAVCSRPILCVSVELNIRYRQPARVGERLLVFGELVQDKKRLILTRGGILDHAGNLLCTGEGKYVPMSESQQQEVCDYAQWGDALRRTFQNIQLLTEG